MEVLWEGREGKNRQLWPCILQREVGKVSLSRNSGNEIKSRMKREVWGTPAVTVLPGASCR